MITERYEMTSGGHFKFWEVTLPNSAADQQCWWEVRFGRIGGEGQTVRHKTASPAEAIKKALAARRAKRDKGYVYVSVAGSALTVSPPDPNGLTGGLGAAGQKNAQPVPVTDMDRKATLALKEAGFASAAIAAKLGLTTQQVAAIVAHGTMGTYGAIPDQTGVGPVVAAADVPKCHRCGGTGRFRRRHGKIETCIVCGGSGADNTAVAVNVIGKRQFALD